MLGYLLERISGHSYEEFVQENIFKPLGMNDSGMFSFVTVIPRRASGYCPGSNGIENADRSFDTRIGFSAGSLYSSTEDLFRWEEGLFGGKLLSPASLRKMTTPFKSDYACGLHVNRVNGHLMIEHDGNNIGLFALVLGIFFATDVAVELRLHLLNSQLARFSVENRLRPGTRSALPVRDTFGFP